MCIAKVQKAEQNIKPDQDLAFKQASSGVLGL